jgi:hypothetical protein
MLQSQVLRKLDFPAYCIKVLDNGILVITGGGGTSKTGVGNSIELGFIEYSPMKFTGEYKAYFKLIHKFETCDAIMKFVTFNLSFNEKRIPNKGTNMISLPKDQISCDIFIAGALDYSIEIYKIDYILKKKTDLSEHEQNPSASIRKVSVILLNEKSNNEMQIKNTETISSLQICTMKKSCNLNIKESIFLCAGTSKGNIIVWKIFLNNNTLEHKRFHVFKDAHHEFEVDGLEVNELKMKENNFEHHLLSTGKDNKCVLWSLDKLCKIEELLYTRDNSLRMKHARFSSKYLYTTYVPRTRSSSKNLCSYVQRWSVCRNSPGSNDSKSSKSTNNSIIYKPENLCFIRNTIITSIQVSGDGNFVSIGDCDGKIYLFDSSFNRIVNFKRQHSSVITDLAFFYDNKTTNYSNLLDVNKIILTISIDRTLQLYKFISLTQKYGEYNIQRTCKNNLYTLVNFHKINIILFVLLYFFCYTFLYIE